MIGEKKKQKIAKVDASGLGFTNSMYITYQRSIRVEGDKPSKPYKYGWVMTYKKL